MSERKTHYKALLKKVQVNVPFRELQDRYLRLFLEYGANPEIGIDSETLDKTSIFNLRQVGETIKENELRITLHAPFMDLVPGGVDRKLLCASRERLNRFFEIIPVFQPVIVVCHTGYNPVNYQGLWEEWLKNSIDTWKPLVQSAERLGVKLLLENVYEKLPNVHLALFDAIESDHFGFCFDVGHHNVFGEGTVKEWLDSLGDKLMEIHLHDNNGEVDTHSAIGKGNVDFVELFNVIKEKKLEPVITLEPHEEDTLWQSLASLQLLWPPDN